MNYESDVELLEADFNEDDQELFLFPLFLLFYLFFVLCYFESELLHEELEKDEEVEPLLFLVCFFSLFFLFPIYEFYYDSSSADEGAS